MVTGKSVLTALTVGALAGSLYAMWITVASAREQAPQLPVRAVAAAGSLGAAPALAAPAQRSARAGHAR